MGFCPTYRKKRGNVILEKTEPILKHDFLLRACDVDVKSHWKLSSILTAGQEMGELHSKQWGFSREEMTERGNFFILTRIRIDVKKMPVFHDMIYATTWSRSPIRTIFPRYFQFADQEGNIYATLSTLWMICDTSTRAILTEEQSGGKTPELDHPTPLEHPRKIRVPDMEYDEIKRTVCFSDLDYNGHMNNAHYADWVCDVLPFDILCERALDGFEVNFLSEMPVKTEVILRRYMTKDAFIIEGIRENDEQVMFRASGIWK